MEMLRKYSLNSDLSNTTVIQNWVKVNQTSINWYIWTQTLRSLEAF